MRCTCGLCAECTDDTLQRAAHEAFSNTHVTKPKASGRGMVGGEIPSRADHADTWSHSPSETPSPEPHHATN